MKWEEINTAIGQSLYLLCVLAHRFNFKFEKHDITLGGSFSKIGLKSNPKLKLELYMPSSEDRFNQGLVLLLDALNQLCSFVCTNWA